MNTRKLSSEERNFSTNSPELPLVSEPGNATEAKAVSLNTR